MGDDLRSRLTDAVQQVSIDPDLPDRALDLGRRLQRRRRWRRATGAVVALGVVAGSVLLLDATAGPAPVAAIRCGAAGAAAQAQQTVRADDNGVTLAVTNTARTPLQLLDDGEGAVVPPGTTRLTLPLAPGWHRIACDGSGATRLVALQVVDPAHAYASSSLQCANAIRRDYSSEGLVAVGDPAELTARLALLPTGYRLRELGYPSAETRVIAVVNAHDEVVEIATWHEFVTPHDWALGLVERCPNSAP